jgi:hypothetical protein
VRRAKDACGAACRTKGAPGSARWTLSVPRGGRARRYPENAPGARRGTRPATRVGRVARLRPVRRVRRRERGRRRTRDAPRATCCTGGIDEGGWREPRGERAWRCLANEERARRPAGESVSGAADRADGEDGESRCARARGATQGREVRGSGGGRPARASRRCGPRGGCIRRRAGDAPGRVACGEAKAKECATRRARGTSRGIPFLKTHAAQAARMERVGALVRARSRSCTKSAIVLAVYRPQVRKYIQLMNKIGYTAQTFSRRRMLRKNDGAYRAQRRRAGVDGY